MKKLLISSFSILISGWLAAQSPAQPVDEQEVQRIESTISADSMQGRKVFTSANDKAASFISDEFKKIGLQPFKNLKGYRQSFTIVKPTVLSISASFDNKPIDSKNIIIYTCSPDLKISSRSGFKKVYIKDRAAFSKSVSEYSKLKENLIVFIDTSLQAGFSRLSDRTPYLFKSVKSVIFVLGNYDPKRFSIKAKHKITQNQTANIVGVLPGKSKIKEFVIFSAHYDHLGTGKAIEEDSIYNGANDDASGVTAVIALAKHYKTVNNNERSLIFTAFTAEEIGGYGSQYFSSQIDPEKAVAMFNIEMIGTESKWGKNSAYITGYEKSDMGKILQKNLQGTNFTFYPDPYTEQNLFYRSDNATLALLGVPAHTISTSKMDDEPNYHKLSDEIETLDINNMTQIIKSIVISASSIVSGDNSPSRVKESDF